MYASWDINFWSMNEHYNNETTKSFFLVFSFVKLFFSINLKRFFLWFWHSPSLCLLSSRTIKNKMILFVLKYFCLLLFGIFFFRKMDHWSESENYFTSLTLGVKGEEKHLSSMIQVLSQIFSFFPVIKRGNVPIFKELK